jgi:carboxymethylenebutenolidase
MTMTINSRLAALSASLLLAFAADVMALSTDDRETLARTAEAHAHDVPVATPAATTRPIAEVTGKTVVYGSVAGQPVSGYLVRPAVAEGPLPGLIVIHEWWGLNDNVRDEAARLAAEGYVVLAVDLYGGTQATEPREAMKQSQRLTANPAPAEDNLHDAPMPTSTRSKARRASAPSAGAWEADGRCARR